MHSCINFLAQVPAISLFTALASGCAPAFAFSPVAPGASADQPVAFEQHERLRDSGRELVFEPADALQ